MHECGDISSVRIKKDEDCYYDTNYDIDCELCKKYKNHIHYSNEECSFTLKIFEQL
jgi:hypothetical protein